MAIEIGEEVTVYVNVQVVGEQPVGDIILTSVVLTGFICNLGLGAGESGLSDGCWGGWAGGYVLCIRED